MRRPSSRPARELPWALDPAHQEPWLRVARDAGAVFLDYDGTLTPIVDRPEDATLSDPMRQTLRRLADRLLVSIVSGRDVDVVAEFVGLDQLIYVGSHGLDIAGPSDQGLRKELAREYLDALDEAEAALRRRTQGIDGVVVERKRFSVSTHVRLAAPGGRDRVDEIVAAVGRGCPSLRREGGKMVFELRPDIDWDKGRAVNWLLDATGHPADDALFLGDDLTDETVFQALAGRGTGIIVADTNRPTAATLRLDSVDEVRTLLERMAGAADVDASSTRDAP